MEDRETVLSMQPLLADRSVSSDDQVTSVGPVDESRVQGLIDAPLPASTGATGGGDGGQTDDFDLDEPVWKTIKRDLDSMSEKFFLVLKPTAQQQLLRNWDLWGPLFLCVMMSLFLHGGSGSGASSGFGGPQFTEAFIVIWFGACVVTLNTKLLGGNISLFQTLCVLGYCLLPLALALVVCQLMFLTAKRSLFLFFSRIVLSLVGFGWACFSSTAFLSRVPPARRKTLVVYPVVLFYLIITWMIISQDVGSA